MQSKNLRKLYVCVLLSQVDDSYLDISRACLCVQNLLKKFANRQLVVTESWEKWQTTIEIAKQMRIEHERKVEESTKVRSLIRIVNLVSCFYNTQHSFYTSLLSFR